MSKAPQLPPLVLGTTKNEYPSSWGISRPASPSSHESESSSSESENSVPPPNSPEQESVSSQLFNSARQHFIDADFKSALSSFEDGLQLLLSPNEELAFDLGRLRSLWEIWRSRKDWGDGGLEGPRELKGKLIPDCLKVIGKCPGQVRW
jgi:hypothetical protein